MPQIGPKLQYNGGKWRLLAILRFAHDRPMLRTGLEMRFTGGEVVVRSHGFLNRRFDGSTLCARRLKC